MELYLVRHGQVFNPKGVIYGHLPGYGLSETGKEQIRQASSLLIKNVPFKAIYASPLQRAQESAAIICEHLNLSMQTETLLEETAIGSFAGKPFSALPKPYITEKKTFAEIEDAESIRIRMLSWVARMQKLHKGHRLIAVSHRDPIIILLLYWMQKNLDALPEFPLDTGAVYQVCLESEHKGHVKRVSN
ncbi:MAG: histidine phosphatase family protein [SAR324 cluster bacterium]|jgi:broad specificity phosphatase PhoE|nr:histidine phosphatase family protein [SAR324 cluster bacterium]